MNGSKTTQLPGFSLKFMPAELTDAWRLARHSPESLGSFGWAQAQKQEPVAAVNSM